MGGRTFWGCGEKATSAACGHRLARAGLTLLELLGAVVVLGVLALVLVPRIVSPATDAKKSACYVNKGEIEVQAQLWYRNKGTWPATNLSDIGASTAYFPQGLPTCPVDGTSYQINSTTHRVVGHVH